MSHVAPAAVDVEEFLFWWLGVPSDRFAYISGTDSPFHFVLLAACSPHTSPRSPIVSRRSERPLPDEAPVSVPLPLVVPVCLVELLLG